MAQMNIIQAVNDALRIEMTRDPKVVVLGEDVGKFGGVFLLSLPLRPSPFQQLLLLPRLGDPHLLEL